MPSIRAISGDKRNDPDELGKSPAAAAASVSVASSPSSAEQSKKKAKTTNATTSTSSPAATKWPPAAGAPIPGFLAKFDPSAAGTPYPSISATTIRTLKWGDARDLMLPFLTKDERTNVHKKTRADLSKMLEARIISGDVTPKDFWAVVGTERVQQQKERKSRAVAAAPVDHKVAAAVAKAVAKNGRIHRAERSPAGAAAATAPPFQSVANGGRPPPPSGGGMPPPMMPGGMPYPRPTPTMAGTSPPGGGAGGPVPFLPLPRPLHKYTLRVPMSIWPSTKYPPGVVVGEPIPPTPLAPPCVAGTFHSSAILSLGLDDDVYEPKHCSLQIGFILRKLDVVLSTLNATHSDIISMTAHVVDIHKNGQDVLKAHCNYMAGKGNATRSVCSWTMVGVSGLLPEGCLVQLEVKAIVRRGPANSLILDRPYGGVKI